MKFLPIVFLCSSFFLGGCAESMKALDAVSNGLGKVSSVLNAGTTGQNSSENLTGSNGSTVKAITAAQIASISSVLNQTHRDVLGKPVYIKDAIPFLAKFLKINMCLSNTNPHESRFISPLTIKSFLLPKLYDSLLPNLYGRAPMAEFGMRMHDNTKCVELDRLRAVMRDGNVLSMTIVYTDKSIGAYEEQFVTLVKQADGGWIITAI